MFCHFIIHCQFEHDLSHTRANGSEEPDSAISDGSVSLGPKIHVGQRSHWPATSSSGHFVPWPPRPLATSTSGHFNLWPIRPLATSSSGTCECTLYAAFWPLLATSTSGQHEHMGLMNSGTLRALANATSGQHESLGRMNVPLSDDPTVHRNGPVWSGHDSGSRVCSGGVGSCSY